MKHCPACQIDYTGDLDRCALCGNELSGTPTESPFPCIPMQRSSKRAQLILGASTLIVLLAWGITCCLAAIPLPSGFAAAGALVLNYLFARNLMAHSPNALRAIKRYFLVIMAIALLWFAATRNPVASTFVIPIISIAAILFDGVLLVLMGSRMVEEYAKYLLYDIVFGIVPPLLILTGTVNWPLLAWCCPMLAALMLAGLLVYGHESVADEVRKLFNA